MTIIEARREYTNLIRLNNMFAVKLFLQQHPQVVQNGDSGRAELHYAARGGNLHLVELLVRLGVNVNAPDIGRPLPPLYSAASLGHTHVVRWLIEHGSAVNFTIDDKPPFCAPLVVAIREGNDELARLLIDAGAELNVHD